MQSPGKFLSVVITIALAAVFVASQMGAFDAPKKKTKRKPATASGSVKEYLRVVKGWDRVNLTAI